MAWQLIYTSAPRLLDAGRSGFGTVARHRDIPTLLVQAVERVSQFARLPGMNANRVIYCHRVIQVSGSRYHVLSKISSAGSDYTGRTNHIAHHLIATDREAAECGAVELTPADILLNYSWLAAWTEPPRSLGAAEEVRLSSVGAYPLQHSQWHPFTGNPDYAWLLITNPAGRGCYLKAPADTDFRPIFLESLRVMDGGAWQPTFTTSLEPTEDAGEFRWIGIEDNSPTLGAAENSGRPILDLTKPQTLPAPDLPQPSAPPPRAVSQPQVHTQLKTPLPSISQHAAPFVEREDTPAVNQQGLGPSPWSKPASKKTPQTTPQKSKNYLYILGAAAGAIVFCFAIANYNRKQAETTATAQREAISEANESAKRTKNARLANIKMWLRGDSGNPSSIDYFFEDAAISEFEGLSQDIDVIKELCVNAQRLVKAYKDADFNTTIDALAYNKINTIPRVRALQEHREKIHQIIKGELSTNPLETGKLDISIASEIQGRTDKIIIQNTQFCVNLSNAVNAALVSDWGPDSTKIKNAIAPTIKAKFAAKLAEQLQGLVDLSAEESKKWLDAVTKAEIDSSDKSRILATLSEKSKAKIKSEIAMSPDGIKKQETISLEGGDNHAASNSQISATPKNVTTNALPQKQSSVMYWFIDQFENLHIPIPQALDLQIKLGRAGKLQTLTELKLASKNYGVNATSKSWFKLQNGFLEAAPAGKGDNELKASETLDISYKTLINDGTVSQTVEIHVFCVGNQNPIPVSPLIDKDAKVTMSADGKLDRELLGTINLGDANLNLAFMITGESAIGKYLGGKLISIKHINNEWFLERVSMVKPPSEDPAKNDGDISARRKTLEQVLTLMKPLSGDADSRKEQQKNKNKIKKKLSESLREKRIYYQTLLGKEKCERLLKDLDEPKEWSKDETWLANSFTSEPEIVASDKGNKPPLPEFSGHPLLGGSNKNVPEEAAVLYGSIVDQPGAVVNPEVKPRAIPLCKIKIGFQ